MMLSEWWSHIVAWYQKIVQEDARPFLKEGMDYTFVDIELTEPVSAVKILSGAFSGVIYYYGGVRIIPEGGFNRLAFQYTIWDSSGHTKDQLVGSREFITHLGDILVSIIADEQGKGEYAAPRIDDPQESDSQ